MDLFIALPVIAVLLTLLGWYRRRLEQTPEGPSGVREVVEKPATAGAARPVDHPLETRWHEEPTRDTDALADDVFNPDDPGDED